MPSGSRPEPRRARTFVAIIPDVSRSPSTASAWRHRSGRLALASPRVVAVVNLTPDSFSDGGRFVAPGSDDANVSVVLRHCERFVQQGADVLDVGGESTRPGASPVDPAAELRRVSGVLERLVAEPTIARVPISIDTRHAEVARRCLELGASIVNDVSGLADPRMAAVVAEHGAGLVVGHLRGEPATMQEGIHFEAVVDEVGDELARAVDRAIDAGVPHDAIVVDPGIGFGKTAEQSAALLGSADRLFARTGCPVLVGASRKSFLAALGAAPPGERLLPSVVAGLVAVRHGAALLRVHDVAATVQALGVVAGIERARAEHGGRP
jgi:dihydropteroate synthase